MLSCISLRVFNRLRTAESRLGCNYSAQKPLKRLQMFAISFAQFKSGGLFWYVLVQFLPITRYNKCLQSLHWSGQLHIDAICRTWRESAEPCRTLSYLSHWTSTFSPLLHHIAPYFSTVSQCRMTWCILFKDCKFETMFHVIRTRGSLVLKSFSPLSESICFTLR